MLGQRFSDQIIFEILTRSPDQIIFEILTRLPAKPATRFRLFSKRFNTLITEPHFTRTYISRAPKTWSILAHINQPSRPTRFQLDSPHRVNSLSVTTPFVDVNSRCKAVRFSSIVGSSKGLVLMEAVGLLFVINVITIEWSLVPHRSQFNWHGRVAFMSRVDKLTGLVDRFIILQYLPILDRDFAIVRCFSSETGKWEEITGTYMLQERLWCDDGTFEFDGTLFWFDLSVGLIFVKDDINLLGTGKKQNKPVQFGFVKLPEGYECQYTHELVKTRFIGVGGGGGAEMGWIQFLKTEKEALKLWRLNDYKCGEYGDWTLAYNVSLRANFGRLVPEPILFNPFEAEVVLCGVGGFLLFVNVRTKEVQRCGSYSNAAWLMGMIPIVIPSWPSPLPTFSAGGAKERGNEYFEEMKYDEAVRWYTTSITCSPTAVAYSNRAAAYLYLNNFVEAEKDCTKCLSLDAHSMKAYWCRVIARKELGKLGEALEDAEHFLKVKPDQAEMIKLVGEIKLLLEQELRLSLLNVMTPSLTSSM